jgi:hypothetical protein
MYKLNTDNPAIEPLHKLALQLASVEIDLQLARQEREEQTIEKTETIKA